MFELADRSECALRFDFKIWLIWFDGEQIPRILKQRLHFHHACYSVPAGWDSSLPADRQESLLQSLPEGSGSTGKLTQGGRMKWCWCVFAFQHERTHIFQSTQRLACVHTCAVMVGFVVLSLWRLPVSLSVDSAAGESSQVTIAASLEDQTEIWCF